jgi:hypothetical protein
MTYHDLFSLSSAFVLQDVLLWYTYDAANIISTTTIAKKIVDYDDRGAFVMFQELVHSWVGYELVKVLLAFGLSPKDREDLEEWSPDLFQLFSFLGDKQWDSSKKNVLKNSWRFSLIKLYIMGILENYHLEARKNIQKWPILHYHWLY